MTMLLTTLVQVQAANAVCVEFAAQVVEMHAACGTWMEGYADLSDAVGATATAERTRAALETASEIDDLIISVHTKLLELTKQLNNLRGEQGT